MAAEKTEAKVVVNEEAERLEAMLKETEAELKKYKEGYAELSAKFQKLFALYANNLDFYLGNVQRPANN